MGIYIFELVTVWLLNIFCFHSKGANYKKQFMIMSFTIMALVLGLRSSAVGEDTDMYLQIFESSSKISWKEIIFSGSKTVWTTTAYGYRRSMESGFILLVRIIGIVSSSPFFINFVIATLTCLLAGRFIYENCETKNLFMATYIFLCESIYVNAFNLCRQVFVITIVLYAYKYLKQNDIIRFIVVVLIASSIHNSAIICLLLIPIVRFSRGENAYKKFKYIIIACVIIPLILPFVVVFINQFLPSYMGYVYNNYWDASINGVVVLWILELILIFLMYQKKFAGVNDYFVLSSIALFYLFIEGIGIQITGVSRLALYFRAFLILFFPATLSCFNGKTKRWVKMIIYTLLTFFFLSYARVDSRTFSFFWQ